MWYLIFSLAKVYTPVLFCLVKGFKAMFNKLLKGFVVVGLIHGIELTLNIKQNFVLFKIMILRKILVSFDLTTNHILRNFVE